LSALREKKRKQKNNKKIRSIVFPFSPFEVSLLKNRETKITRGILEWGRGGG
jgi:hypothetical protein